MEGAAKLKAGVDAAGAGLAEKKLSPLPMPLLLLVAGLEKTADGVEGEGAEKLKLPLDGVEVLPKLKPPLDNCVEEDAVADDEEGASFENGNGELAEGVLEEGAGDEKKPPPPPGVVGAEKENEALLPLEGVSACGAENEKGAGEDGAAEKKLVLVLVLVLLLVLVVLVLVEVEEDKASVEGAVKEKLAAADDGAADDGAEKENPSEDVDRAAGDGAVKEDEGDDDGALNVKAAFSPLLTPPKLNFRGASPEVVSAGANEKPVAASAPRLVVRALLPSSRDRFTAGGGALKRGSEEEGADVEDGVEEEDGEEVNEKEEDGGAAPKPKLNVDAVC